VTRVSQSDPNELPYLAVNGVTYRRVPVKGKLAVLPLCNFSAQVTQELLLDDGVDVVRAYILEGRLSTGERLPRVQVPARQFEGMRWTSEHWGARAVVRAGQGTKEHLRAAIQYLSGSPARKRVFVHTGWRRDDVTEAWFYLPANGAVGRDDLEVRLDPGLERYALPSDAKDPETAMRMSLRLLGVAHPSITVPLFSAMFRAPLAVLLPCDFTIWVEGHSNSLKSSAVALFLSHFGQFDRVSLPGSWASTMNSIERRLFTIKDAPFVLDDFAPRVGLDARDLQTKANRVLRAQGNISSRGRLRQDLTEHSGFPPRGLLIATGEQRSSGESLVARSLVIAMKRSDVNLPVLTAGQRCAVVLPHAMSAYIAWLAPQMDDIAGTIKELFYRYREAASTGASHLRVPEVIAHLMIGLDYALSFAQAIGTCTEAEAERRRDEGWIALLGIASQHAQLIEAERPTLRFLHLLATMISQGRAFLVPRGDVIAHEGQGRSDFVGWFDDIALYLLPDGVWAATAKFARDSGDPFSITEDRLRRELVEEGLAWHDPGRTLKTIRMGEATRRVLQLSLAKITEALGEGFPVVPAVTVVPGV